MTTACMEPAANRSESLEVLAVPDGLEVLAAPDGLEVEAPDGLVFSRSGCPTNGVKKRPRKSRKKHVNTEVDFECAFEGDAQTSPQDTTSWAVLQSSPGPVTRSQAALGTPVRGMSSIHIQSSPCPVTRSQVALGTPIRGASVLPVLQTSPGPVTRRQLALAKASEGVSGNPISPRRSVVTAAKKITPKRKKRS